jgi:hypothetical protein
MLACCLDFGMHRQDMSGPVQAPTSVTKKFITSRFISSLDTDVLFLLFSHSDSVMEFMGSCALVLLRALCTRVQCWLHPRDGNLASVSAPRRTNFSTDVPHPWFCPSWRCAMCLRCSVTGKAGVAPTKTEEAYHNFHFKQITLCSTRVSAECPCATALTPFHGRAT